MNNIKGTRAKEWNILRINETIFRNLVTKCLAMEIILQRLYYQHKKGEFIALFERK